MPSVIMPMSRMDWPRHPHRPGAAGPPGRQHHDDLHPRPQPGSGGGAQPGRPNVHVMDLDRPDYHATGTGQIYRGIVRYIIALELGSVLQDSAKMKVHRLRRTDTP